MTKLHSKLRSSRGASMTFALLLFLVCAVFGAVMLRAATAAAGRMSRTAELDQRYYAVTSAAALLQETLDGKPATVTTTTTTEKVTTYTDGAPGTPAPKTAAEPATNPTVVTEKNGDSILLAAAGDLIWAEEDESTSKQRDLTLTAGAGADEVKAALSVDILQTVYKDGRMTLDISKSGGSDSSAETYTLRLSFELEHTTATDTLVTDGTPRDMGNVGDDFVYYVDTVETVTVKDTYLWKLVDVSAVGGAA